MSAALALDETHDPALASWVVSANAAHTDFPIQNLPFGRFRRGGTAEAWRIGVAIGEQILDLAGAAAASGWPGVRRRVATSVLWPSHGESSAARADHPGPAWPGQTG